VSDRLRVEITFECEQIEELLRKYSRLLGRLSGAAPDEVEIAAVGALLHSFYNGVENLFKRIVIAEEGQLPRGDFWHRDLLESMARPATGAPVISVALCDRLKPYLHFRHVFRSAYVLMLQWDKMAPLVEDLAGAFAQLKSELKDFVDRPDRGPAVHP